MIEYDETEWDFRRRRYVQLRDGIDGLKALVADIGRDRADARPEFETIRSDFLADGDAQRFRTEMDSWSKRYRLFGFAAMNGQMFLNQLVNDSDEAAIAPLLQDVILAPPDDVEAAARFDRLIDHVEAIRQTGSAAQAGRIPTFLSWWWWMDQPDEWPAMFSSAAQLLADLWFIDTEAPPWDRYVDFRRHVQQFGPWTEVEQALGQAHLSAHGIDPSAVDRCRRVSDLGTRPDEDDGTFAMNRASVNVLRGMARHMGASLSDLVADAIGVPVKASTPTEFWNADTKRLREDIWVSWRLQLESPQPMIQLIIDAEGIKVGLFASYQQAGGKGYGTRVREILDGHEPSGLTWLPWGIKTKGPGAGEGEAYYSLLGAMVPWEAAVDRPALDEVVRETVTALKPAVERIWEHTGTAPTEAPAAEADGDDRLLALRAQFIDEVGYPTSRDTDMNALRREFAELLQPRALPSIPMAELRRMYGGGGYGNPGPQSILHVSLRDGGEAATDRFLTAIQYLLWDDVDNVEARINRVMDEDDLGLRGLKESVILKFLAIAHPDRFLPVFPFSGERGKAALLQVIDEDPPPMTLDVGTRQVQSNDQLRALIEPLFPKDPWGQAQFLYWLQEREESTGASIDDAVDVEVDRLGQAADALHLPRGFLEEVHSLLDRHKQVVFYGPPGTGKTYVAQALAEAIAPDDEQRMLIQFHPSSSYEDFFEGFRPGQARDGGISYSLVDGPLRRMAEHARSDPRGRPHVLIIDEINRANLAKVLGELLFLLEYRGKELRPLYRPDEPFSLPDNLWLIGTMNTADRSIATVDAALRRRFHFVPFVPDDREDNPISGLLRRWLNANDEPTWVADLVDGVNQQLRKELGGDHLLLGPSYFMREGLDRTELTRIWRYQIEPLVDDLFFGSEKAKAFRFEAVWRRHGPPAVED